ncbi:MAG: MmgE/PrpD family protein [Planctomycetes bacterium]|nr:MmgE/PrpD family protein [Planctomycetota bacterium]
MSTITLQLSEWASRLEFGDLDAQTVEAAKRFLYDSIGCALGGYRQEDTRMLLAHLREMGGEPQCTLIGSPTKSSVVSAALYNALAIRAMDYNDIYWKADPCHPSDIIPAATSIAEWKRLSGRELIVGIVLGHEMEMRYCEAAEPGIRERGWHHATLTAFVSPMVAARMLRLDPEQMQHAIGISASHSCTLGAVTAGKLTKMKNTVDPMATQAGVQAALLAKEGFSGPEHVVDGKEGLVHCFGPEWNLGKLTDGLGERFKINECGMKAFPIEALSHSPLTATLQIVHQHDIQPDDVVEIKVETIARAADILSDPAKYRPTSKETADHSLPYCLAVAVADRQVTPQQFLQERITDPKLFPLMDAVKAVGNDDFEALFPEFQPSRVTITTKSGESHSARVDVPKGDYRDPMSMEEIRVKFEALAEGAFTQSECDRIGETIDRLDDLADVGELMSLLVPAVCGTGL